jgi:hypothetical protein
VDSKQAKNLIRETFNRSFDKNLFIRFVKELLNEIDESKAKVWPKQYVKHAFHEGVQYYERIGTYIAPEGEKIDILIVYLEKETTLERARTLQRNFAAHHLKTRAEKDAGLVAFVSPNNDDWRFSLVKMEYNLERAGKDKVKVKEELTPSKRFSFIVGKNENSHTAQKQLLPILEEDKHNPTLKEIEKSFSIEIVTKDFFNKYKDLFLSFTEELEKIIEKDSKIKKDFEIKGINTADFGKKLFGQIVFLYFLQRKGWLGVDKEKEWGEGSKNFLRALFDKKYCEYDNFFNEVLEPFFYEALATDRDNAYYDKFNCKIPFLNGGLFEPLQSYDWVNTDIIIPNDLFSNDYKTKEGDLGSGILDFFDRYNFTIKEDEPLEKEVAIDPEMLGKVFENLLEIKDRKSKGAFYTPREIVHYMCQESLINHLTTELEEKVPKEDLEIFIHLGDFAVEHDMAKIQGVIKDDGKYKLPKLIHEHAELIDQKLANITVCDPAIGSGAFLVGMMNEIVRARGSLNATRIFEKLKVKRTPYYFKRHAIENSLYGVDVDSGAVEIAKLRLWLSLVVDEDEMTDIKPLPNLDYKIMQGNSLLEEYEGIKLFDESLILDTEKLKKERLAKINSRKSLLQQEYFKLHSDGKLTKNKKTEVEKEMKALSREEAGLNKVQIEQNGSLFEKVGKSMEKAQELNRLHKEFFNVAQKSRKSEIKKKIDMFEWELIEETLKEQGKEKELPKLEGMKLRNDKPFFLWKLHFAEVFQGKGGFDVVIANPPYVSLEKISDHKSSYKEIYQVASARGDLYCLFYELGVKISKPNSGLITYISSNKWMHCGYGEVLRRFFVAKNPLKLLNFGGFKMFENATVDTNILILENCTNLNALEACHFKNDYEPGKDLLNYFLENRVHLKNINSNIWFIGSEKELLLKSKIEKLGKPLKEWNVKINFGIKTGFNEAFIIDRKKRNELIKEDFKSAKIIRPILRGRDIKRYGHGWEDQYIIITKFGSYETLHYEYPAIYKHLKKYENKLKNRGQCKYSRAGKNQTKADYDGQHHWLELDNNPGSEYIESFEKEKIVWKRIGSIIRFLFDEEGFLCQDSTCIMTGEKVKYLTAILNSKVGCYLLQNSPRTGTGDLILSVQALNPIIVPEVIPVCRELVSQIESLVDCILDSKKKDPKIDTLEFEREIDNLVYKLYHLTPEEIQIIESNLQ